MRRLRVHRLKLLALCRDEGAATADRVAEALRMSNTLAHKALANAAVAGDLCNDGRGKPYRLTAQGLKKVGGTLKDAAGPLNVLADELAAVIARHELGMDSSQLAQRFAITIDEVDDALAPAVAAHAFVTCVVTRGDETFTLYRQSAGLARNWRDWSLTAGKPPAANVAATPSAPLLDGTAEPAALETVTESSAAVDDPDMGVMWCALFSTGELCLQRLDGTQVSLDPDETRYLFRWLDQIGGTNLRRLTEVAA
jgi:hypothetical protein